MTSTYEAGWDRAFARVDADLAAERAAQRRLEAAAERGARATVAPELLTFDEAADRLKMTNRTVRNLISRGVLTRVDVPTVKGSPRVAADEVAALMEAS